MSYGKLYSESGSMAVTALSTKTVTFPITFSLYCTAISNCNGNAFTCSTTTVNLTDATFNYNNKNKTNSSSFNTVYWLAMGT